MCVCMCVCVCVCVLACLCSPVISRDVEAGAVNILIRYVYEAYWGSPPRLFNRTSLRKKRREVYVTDKAVHVCIVCLREDERTVMCGVVLPPHPLWLPLHSMSRHKRPSSALIKGGLVAWDDGWGGNWLSHYFFPPQYRFWASGQKNRS